jgi:hypothetical protein
MRHLRGLAPIEVALLPRRVIGPAGLGLLIPAAGAAPGIPSPELAAGLAAVHVAVVAPPAKEEHLIAAATADEAKGYGGGGVHGSRRGHQELDAGLEPCDEHLVVPTARACDTEGSSFRLGPSLFSAASVRLIPPRRPGPLLGLLVHPVQISAELRDH